MSYIIDTVAGCGDDGIPTTAACLQARVRLGRRDASGMVHQARELRHLTATGAALATGSISTVHTAEIVTAKKRSVVTAKKRSGLGTDEFASYEQEQSSPQPRHCLDGPALSRPRKALRSPAIPPPDWPKSGTTTNLRL